MLGKVLSIFCTSLLGIFLGSCVTLFGDRDAHELHGKIWFPQKKEFVDLARVKKAMNDSKVVLIGERHDHPEHHKMQLDLIKSMPKNKVKALNFEHMDRRQQVALSQFNKGKQGLDELKAKLNWEKSGWPPWDMYQSIFAYGKTAGLPLYAANIDKDALKSVMDLGYEIVFDLNTVQQMGLKKPLPGELHNELSSEIEAAHCQKLDPSLKEKMVRAQRARDAYMALSIHRRLGDDSVNILLAGNGHVRNDRGVPYYLAALGVQGSDMVSIGIVEIGPDEPEQPAVNYPYDYVFFTKRIDSQDPCEKYKEQLDKIKAGASSQVMERKN